MIDVIVLTTTLSRNGGGVFTVVSKLYKTLDKNYSGEFNVRLFGYRDNMSDVDIKDLSIPLRLYRRWNNFYFSLRLLFDFLKLGKKKYILHIHSMWLFPSFVVSVVRTLNPRVRIIYSTHGMLEPYALNTSYWKKRLVLFLFEKRNLIRSDFIHALNLKEVLDIQKIARDARCIIIPNGVELSMNMANRTANQKRFLFLGRLHSKKGIDNLIEAWFKANTNDWCLYIVGPDEMDYTQKIQMRNAQCVNVKKHIIVENSIFGSAKEDLLNSCTVFILPSFSEGLPMAVLEAWAHGLPVLMTAECNLNEGFQNDCAIEIKPTIDSIMQGLELFCNMDMARISEMGENGRKLVANHYTWENSASKLSKLYNILEKDEINPDLANLI